MDGIGCPGTRCRAIVRPCRTSVSSRPRSAPAPWSGRTSASLRRNCPSGTRRRRGGGWRGVSQRRTRAGRRLVRQAIDDVVALLAGERRDLSHLPIDLSATPEFNRRVYAVALAIPPGETLTYGEVAAQIGEPGAARAVGVALGQNPIPIIVPCHRARRRRQDRRLLGRWRRRDQAEILTIERARTSAEPSLFDDLPLQARRR